RPITDLEAYRRSLARFVFQSGRTMEPFWERASSKKTRIAFAEGEQPRVLRAVQQILDNNIASPILIGRPEVVKRRAADLGLSFDVDTDIELVNPEKDSRFREYWTHYHQIMGRSGVSPTVAQTIVRGNNSVIAALMCKRGEVDGFICGTLGRFEEHLDVVTSVIGNAPGIQELSTITALILPRGTFFICDSHISHDPSAEELAEMTLLAAAEVRHFGLEPKVALVSRSQFGSHNYEAAQKMRGALAILHERAPQMMVDGEMHADAAISESIRQRSVSDSSLVDSANLLIMPNVDAAHISVNLLKELGGGVAVGPLLIGAAKPVNILTESASVRGIVNMTAVTAVQIQEATVHEPSA
ncbi:MAG: NADP-dependent malic enzyme, partial [Chromatiales bacterium]|nr:NADP-dependent malic enzyme [Chromatiales bacterium]